MHAVDAEVCIAISYVTRVESVPIVNRQIADATAEG
jgi:hypothetical protein